ncbi:hypothetical protein ACFXGA_33815 [Actinosynnema sp. NPDC059335]|uniref:hypothetical protein n=1 Tax=Actinosynnema sp. NPDC059335 TaxID=3346804 RepID=UPI003672FCFB
MSTTTGSARFRCAVAGARLRPHPMRDPVRAVFHLCPLAPRPDLGHVDTEATP